MLHNYVPLPFLFFKIRDVWRQIKIWNIIYNSNKVYMRTHVFDQLHLNEYTKLSRIYCLFCWFLDCQKGGPRCKKNLIFFLILQNYLHSFCGRFFLIDVPSDVTIYLVIYCNICPCRSICWLLVPWPVVCVREPQLQRPCCSSGAAAACSSAFGLRQGRGAAQDKLIRVGSCSIVGFVCICKKGFLTYHAVR